MTLRGLEHKHIITDLRGSGTAGKPKHPAAVAKAQQRLVADVAAELTHDDNSVANLPPIPEPDEGCAAAVLAH